jgi:serine/threonine protein kinase
MIMEYAGGGMLLDYLQDHYPLGEVKARNIFLQIVSAIHYCHLKGVVHRDLKLENVIFRDEKMDIVKLIDFGIAGVCTKGREDVQESGTMEYMPPELFEQSKVTSSPSQDVWAIGIMFYTMIYGTLPFRGKTDKELREKIKEAKLVFPKGVPITQESKDIIRGMLHPDPA